MSKILNNLDEALKAGNKLKVFRSGGGLRVMYMWDRYDNTKTTTYYGESHDFDNALRVLNNDIQAGHREYKDVYGPIEQHYLTGSYGNEENKVDFWVVSGHTIMAEYVDEFKGFEHIEVELLGSSQQKYPQEIINRCTNGESLWWKYDDSEIVRLSQQYTFPGNGEKGCTSKIIFNPKKEETGPHEKILIVGEGDTFLSALLDAMKQLNEHQTKNRPFTIMDGDIRKDYLKQHQGHLYDATNIGGGGEREAQNP